MRKIISIMLVCMMLTTTCFAGTFTKTSNGSSISINVDQGKTILLKAREIFGKIFTGWTITGATVSDASLSEQTITMPNGNVSATANYATPYTITVEQSANGVISPSTVTVAEGSSKTFSITPNTGHAIESVTVDGVNQGAINSYTFSNVNGNHTITATYSSTGGSGNTIISQIPIGSYITYQPNISSYTASTGNSFVPSSATSWRVFKNNGGQLDIISSSNVGGLTLSNKAGFQRCVQILNSICSQYVNPAYATSGRSVGCVVGSSIEVTTSTICDDNDPYYIYDLHHMLANGFRFDSDTWLASRAPMNEPFRARVRYATNVTEAMTPADMVSSKYLYNVNNGTNSATYNVLPIVSLKAGLKITGGDGTQSNPYTISN